MKKFPFLLITLLYPFFPLTAQLVPEQLLSVFQDKTSFKVEASTLDQDNNMYIMATYVNTELDNDKLASQGDKFDVLVAKLNSDGTIAWVKRFGSDEYDRVGGIAYYNNKLYVTALVKSGFNLETPFNRDNSQNTMTDIESSGIILCYSNEGEIDWFKTIYSENGNIYPQAIKVNSEGIFISGQFEGTTAFLPKGETGTFYESLIYSKAFLGKYDLNGNLNWVNVFKSTFSTQIWDMDISQDGIYLAGHYSEELDIDGKSGSLSQILISPSGEDGFLIKCDFGGNYVWGKRYGSSNIYGSRKISTLGSEIFISGIFSGNINFNTPSLFNGTNELTSHSNRDGFIAKYSSTGDVLWLKRFGTVEAVSQLKTNTHRLMIGGTFSGDTLNFSTPYVYGEEEYTYPKKGLRGFATEIDLNGTLLSTKIFDSDFSSALDQVVLSNKEVLFTGSFEKNIYFKDQNDNNSDSLFDNGNRSFFQLSEFDLLPVWQKSYGDLNTAGGYQALSMDTDLEGNSYITGYFHDGIKFGSLPIMYAQGDKDIFILKIDKWGKPLWSKRAGGTGEDTSLSIRYVDGWLYLTGSFEFTANFSTPYSAGNNELISAGGKDIFIIKCRSLDGFIFVLKRAGGVLDDEGRQITSLNNSIYISGWFNVTANFNTPSAFGTNVISSAGGEDIFLAKLSPTGEPEWLKRAGGLTNDRALGLDVEGSAVVIGGFFSGTANFNSPSSIGTNELISSGLNDVFVAKYSTSGSLNFIRRGGGSFNDQLLDLKINNGDIYATGFFSEQAFFPGPVVIGGALNSQGQGDAFLIKYTPSGIPAWKRRAGGNLNDAGTVIRIAMDEVVVTGYFRETINFDYDTTIWGEEYTSDGNRDVFLARYSTSGILLTTKRAGGSGDDVARGMSFDGNQLYLSGFSDDLMNFNTPSISSQNYISKNGDPYIFLSKFLFTTKSINTLAQGRSSQLKSGSLNHIGFLNDGQILLGTFEGNLQLSDTSINGFYNGRTALLTKIDDEAKRVWHNIIGFSESTLNVKLTEHSNSLYISMTPNGYKTAYFYNNGLDSLEKTGKEALISKFDKDGNSEWASKLRGSSSLAIFSLASCDDGVYIGGRFTDSLIFETNSNTNFILSENSLSDVFILKINTEGAFQWARRMGGSLANIGVDNTGAYVTGYYSNSINFNTPSTYTSNVLTSNLAYNYYIAKFDSNGNPTWQKSFSSTVNSSISSLSVGNSNIFIGLNTEDSNMINFSSPYTVGSSEFTFSHNSGLLISYDLGGNFQWLNKFYQTDEEGSNFYPIIVDIGSGPLIIETFQSGLIYESQNTILNGQLPFYDNKTIALLKYDNMGNFEWSEAIVGSSNNTSNGAYYSNGKLAVWGIFSPFSNFLFKNHSLSINESVDFIRFGLCSIHPELQSSVNDINNAYHLYTQPIGSNLSASNIIQGNAEVEFIANSILLEPGFVVEKGTVFMAVTGGCNNE